MARYVMKNRTYLCPEGHKFVEMLWDSDPLPSCPICGQTSDLYADHSIRLHAPAVHGDEIDIWVKNGICNDDGSPKRYRSKSEIRAAAAARGLVIYGETPK